MDESQKRGTTSSPVQTPQHSLRSKISTLSDIASSKPIQKIFNALGSDSALHLVGGTVRDTLLGFEGVDLDLASSLPAEEILKRLEKQNLRVIPTGLHHGTVTCVIDEKNIEITTFRAGRGIGSQTIEEDLAGRDFTVNAIAFDVSAQTLIDPYKGIHDLERSFLVAVGDAEKRFSEDPLRILRMVRFGAAQGRTIEEKTKDTARRLVSTLSKVSIERIRSELEKIVVSSHAAEGIRMFHEIGALPYTFPELIPTIGFEQNRFHDKDVFEHSLDVLEKSPRDKLLRLIALYHDIGKAHTLSVDSQGQRHFYDHEKVSFDICKQSMERLRFSNEDTEIVSKIVRLHMRPFSCGPSGVRRLLRDSGEHFDLWRAFKDADEPGVFDEDLYAEQKRQFDEMVYTERNRKVGNVNSGLEIDGNDLIALGMTPGKALGEILKKLQEEVIEDPEKNTRDYLHQRAQELLDAVKH